MITKRFSGMVAVASIVLLASCGKKSPSYTKYIPKDANYVVGVDVKSLLEKLQKDSMSVENVINTLKTEDNTSNYTKALETYNQLKDAGVDWSSRVYLAASMSGSSAYNVEMVAGLKDAAQFESFLKKQPDTKEIKKGENYSYTGDGEKTIGWNKDAVIIVLSESTPSYDDFTMDSTGSMTRPQSETNATASADLLKTYFKLDNKTSINEAEGFGDLQSKKSDIVVYSQTGDLSKNMPMLAMVPKLKELLKGYSTSTVDFQDGKIVTESTGHLGKELADLLKKYAGPEVDMSLIENYPSQNVDGVIAFSFKPELILGVLKEIGYDGPATTLLSQVGLSPDDVSKFFKGDFAVVVSDFGIGNNMGVAGKDAMASPTSITPTAKMVFAAKLGDKAVVDKLLKLAQDKGLIIRNGNSLVPNPQSTGGAPFPYAISIANDMLVFASDSATFNAYQAKSQKISLPSGVESTLKGNAVGAYVDAQKIMAGISPSLFDSSNAAGKAVLDRAKVTFKDGWYTFSNLSGNTITSKAEMHFVDEKKNSLAQIASFGLYAYQQFKAQRDADAKTMESLPSDSTAVDTAEIAPAR